jgi:AmmeMemoRadiSam system protein A
VAIYGGEGEGNPTLTAAQRERLLSVARGAIEGYVTRGEVIEVESEDPALTGPAGAFVTLRKRGVLRGCIGSLVAEKPLIETVRDMAIRAACRDPRFPAVQPEELEELAIEISVLSPMRRVESAEEIDLGRHGVVVEQGRRRGVYLPQVAQETGWDREELLTHLCREKAGLPADAWRGDATLYVFTAEAFHSPAPEG